MLIICFASIENYFNKRNEKNLYRITEADLSNENSTLENYLTPEKRKIPFVDSNPISNSTSSTKISVFSKLKPTQSKLTICDLNIEEEKT